MKQISLNSIRVILEVYVIKNPTCFSRWSVRDQIREKQTFEQAQTNAFTKIHQINGRKFTELVTLEDATAKEMVLNSISYSNNKQIKIISKQSPNAFDNDTVYYVENINGLAFVTDVRFKKLPVLGDLQEFEEAKTNQYDKKIDVKPIIQRINNIKINDLEKEFEMATIKSPIMDFDHKIMIYKSLTYPNDKQVIVSDSNNREATIYVENKNGDSKVVDVTYSTKNI